MMKADLNRFGASGAFLYFGAETALLGGCIRAVTSSIERSTTSPGAKVRSRNGRSIPSRLQY